MRKVTKAFENSPIKRECKKCHGKHGVGYVTNLDGSVHILMYCKRERETSGIEFESGLKIPSVLSIPAMKHNRRIDALKQTDIFNYLTKRKKYSEDSVGKKLKPYRP